MKTYTLNQYQEEMEERIQQEISWKGERERIMEERHQQEVRQLHLQMEERDQQTRERERELERQKEEELQEKERELQEMQRELQERERQFQKMEGQLQKELRKRKRQLQQVQEEKLELHIRNEDRESQFKQEIEELHVQNEDRERQLQQEIQELHIQNEDRERQLQQEIQELRVQNEERERQFQEREQELQQQLEQTQQQLEDKEAQLEEQQSAWVVNGDEIRMTETLLGNGGYGEVRVVQFRGLRVAAKSLHRVILSPYNQQVFSREMEIASKVRHPNLLQFIGATREGNPIILTELMPTSLRKELETGFPLPYTTILNISLDVACALNYLHLFKPHPIIHRDISSGNVLLQPTFHMGIGWRAKVSDYGSANLQNLIATTENPGNRIYSAPEAGNPREHSPAMDVFSYGVLLIEMSICAIPQPGNRRQDINSIRRAGFKSLVQRCVMDNCKLRPKMSDIINELTQSI